MPILTRLVIMRHPRNFRLVLLPFDCPLAGGLCLGCIFDDLINSCEECTTFFLHLRLAPVQEPDNDLLVLELNLCLLILSAFNLN